MKDYLDLWTEDEKTLWIDAGFTKSVGFITTEDGWGIDKKYLAHRYLWQLIQELENEFSKGVPKDLLMAVASKVERDVRKNFKKALRGFKLLDQSYSRNGDKLWNELTVDYFKYVLKGELFDMIYRVEAVIDEHYNKDSSREGDFFMRELIRALSNLDSAVKSTAYVDLDEEETE